MQHAGYRIERHAAITYHVQKRHVLAAKHESELEPGHWGKGEQFGLGHVGEWGGGQSVRPCPESVNQTFNLFLSDRMRTKSRSRKT